MTPTIVLALLAVGGDPSPEPPPDLKRTPIKIDIRPHERAPYTLIRNDSGFDLKDVRVVLTLEVRKGLGKVPVKGSWPLLRAGQVVRLAEPVNHISGGKLDGSCVVAGSEQKFTASYLTTPIDRMRFVIPGDGPIRVPDN